MDLLTPAMDPKVSDVFPKSKQQETYYAALSDELLSRYPVLGLQAPGYPALYDLLTTQPGSADQWIDQTLAFQEEQIQVQLTQVGEAKSLRDLEAAVTQSMLLQSALTNFKEFGRAEQSFEDEIGSQDFLQQMLNKYVDPSVGYGFGALLLLQGTKFFFKDSSPWINAALTGLSPLIRAFTTYAVVSMAAGTVYQAGKVEHTKQNRDQIEGLTEASTSDGAFFDRGQAQAANSAYHWAVGMFIGRLAVDSLLMYRPMVMDVVRAMNTQLSAEELAGDVGAFRTLGLRAGDWESIDGRMDVLERTGVAQNPEAWKEIELSALRLKIRLRANETWLPKISPASQKLIRLLSNTRSAA